MSAPEKCPKCGSKVIPCEWNLYIFQFECSSILDIDRNVWSEESDRCISNQRDQLAAKLATLESDFAKCSERMKRFRSRWLAAHKMMMEMENEAERASERVKRLEEAGDSCCIYGPESVLEQWRKAKETIP